MKKEIKLEDGEMLSVKQNLWTGTYYITYKNKVAKKLTKNAYIIVDGEEKHVFNIYGNLFKGISLSFQHKYYLLFEPIPWYAYILGFLPFVMTMVLGNLAFLANLGFYYVGGGIGGGISGALSFLGIMISAYFPKHWQKILILLASIVVTFGICFGLGNLIVLAFSN